MAVMTACRMGMSMVLMGTGLQPAHGYMYDLMQKNHIRLEWHGLWERTLEDQKKIVEKFKHVYNNKWLIANNLEYLNTNRMMSKSSTHMKTILNRNFTEKEPVLSAEEEQLKQEQMHKRKQVLSALKFGEIREDVLARMVELEPDAAVVNEYNILLGMFPADDDQSTKQELEAASEEQKVQEHFAEKRLKYAHSTGGGAMKFSEEIFQRAKVAVRCAGRAGDLSDHVIQEYYKIDQKERLKPLLHGLIKQFGSDLVDVKILRCAWCTVRYKDCSVEGIYKEYMSYLNENSDQEMPEMPEEFGVEFGVDLFDFHRFTEVRPPHLPYNPSGCLQLFEKDAWTKWVDQNHTHPCNNDEIGPVNEANLYEMDGDDLHAYITLRDNDEARQSFFDIWKDILNQTEYAEKYEAIKEKYPKVAEMLKHIQDQPAFLYFDQLFQDLFNESPDRPDCEDEQVDIEEYLRLMFLVNAKKRFPCEKPDICDAAEKAARGIAYDDNDLMGFLNNMLEVYKQAIEKAP